MAKLLVVDDEKNLRLVVEKEMTRQGHDVAAVEDGEAAWALLDDQRLRAQIAHVSRDLPDIVADSPQMKEALRLINRVAPSDTSVLITGESGVGKELVAQAIHRLSNRADKPFIDLNCAALQDTL